MNKQQIEQQIAELQAQLEELEKAEPLPGPLTEPLKLREEYCYAIHDGRVEDDLWTNNPIDWARLQAGLIFPYTDEGRKAAEARAQRGLVPMVEAEGPLTEEPEMGNPYLLGSDLRIYTWQGDRNDKEWLRNGQLFPFTPGGAAGAMLKLQELRNE